MAFPLTRLADTLVYKLAMHRLRADNRLTKAATCSEGAFSDWRDEELHRQWFENFTAGHVRGKRVLDLGCGTGGLTFLVRDLGASHVTGIDLSDRQLDTANSEARKRDLTDVVFRRGEVDRIPAANGSAEVILCFDVMEHVMEYEAVIREWERVLAPGGRVLLWWEPWGYPYSHHLGTMLPLPWAHFLMSGKMMYRVCARVYDDPAFTPSFWHLDENGNRKPNPYVGMQRAGDLNRLTTWKFERVCRRCGLRIARREFHAFRGHRFRLLKRALASIPRLQEFFSSYTIYEVEKRSQSATRSPGRGELPRLHARDTHRAHGPAPR
jgi:SAM-dependent methyltransferase